jgi:DNA-3-methyladenine glycosylase I
MGFSRRRHSFIAHSRVNPIPREYHETQYGFSLQDDNLLFERLILEINQAGPSWITILKKANNLRSAYSKLDLETVASFSETDGARLLSDAGIIRNCLKVNAAIQQAWRIQTLRMNTGLEIDTALH